MSAIKRIKDYLGLITAVSFILLGIGAITIRGYTLEQQVDTNTIDIATLTKTTASIVESVTENNSLVKNIFLRGLINEGECLVRRVGDEPGVWINNLDRNIARLKGRTTIRIINKSNSNFPTVDLPVAGYINNKSNTGTWSCEFSLAAGELLGSVPTDADGLDGRWINVQWEPITDNGLDEAISGL